CADPANQHPDQNALWYLSDAGANQTAVKVVDTATGQPLDLDYLGEFGGISLDLQSRRLFITDEYQGESNAGHIVVGQLSADGHSITLVGSSTANIGASGATESGTTITITTTAPHGFVPGNSVRVAGVGVAGYNGVVTVRSATSTTFTYNDPRQTK